MNWRSTRRPTSMTSSWWMVSASFWPMLMTPAAMLVTREMPRTWMPMWRAMMTSWTVDMPTRSAPRVRKARISAGGFEAGAENGEVDAFGEGEAMFFALRRWQARAASGSRRWTCRRSVRRSRVRGQKRGSLGPSAGVGAGEVDVVRDGYQGALWDVGADAAGGVRDDERGAAEETEDAGGEGDLREGVALIGVDAALHDGYGDSADGAEDELAGVAGYGGDGEMGDVGVGDGDGGLDLRGEVA